MIISLIRIMTVSTELLTISFLQEKFKGSHPPIPPIHSRPPIPLLEILGTPKKKKKHSESSAIFWVGMVLLAPPDRMERGL